ncbi:MAG: site-specific DNA-methyltransferase [Candidatus Aenigmatarchaeota archaeon]
MEIDKFLDDIIVGDAIKLMKKMPDNSVDMTFADPPFNLRKSYENYKDNKEIEEYIDWCTQWIFEMVRITKPTGSIFVHNIPRWLTYFSAYMNTIAKFRHWISWDSMGNPLGKTLLPSHYGILWYVKSNNFKFYDIRAPHKTCRDCGAFLKDYGGKKDQIHKFGTLVSDVWTDVHRIRHKNRRDKHPCQLPVALLERLILMSTDENDIVLDPFVGTGTTAIAAKRLGRHYIGFDINPKYVDMSKRKLNDVEPTKINGCYLSIFLNKIMTIRDKDVDKIANFLQTRTFRINGSRTGEYKLPILKNVKQLI